MYLVCIEIFVIQHHVVEITYMICSNMSKVHVESENDKTVLQELGLTTQTVETRLSSVAQPQDVW